MTWNYRIIRKTVRMRSSKTHSGTVHFYDIHEVYYDKKGKPYNWTLEPVTANGRESVMSLRRALSIMLCDALKHPVLEIVGKKNKKQRLVERNTDAR